MGSFLPFRTINVLKNCPSSLPWWHFSRVNVHVFPKWLWNEMLTSKHVKSSEYFRPGAAPEKGSGVTKNTAGYTAERMCVYNRSGRTNHVRLIDDTVMGPHRITTSSWTGDLTFYVNHFWSHKPIVILFSSIQNINTYFNVHDCIIKDFLCLRSLENRFIEPFVQGDAVVIISVCARRWITDERQGNGQGGSSHSHSTDLTC